MEPNVEEALRAREYAEKRFSERDYLGAKSYAVRAQMLCPQLEGIAQMLATFEVYISSEVKVNGETDFYSVLGLKPSADKAKLKRQYKKMAVLLHPDKNKTIGADGAFKLISEAWTILSDSYKRSSYDLRRNGVTPGVVQTNSSSYHTGVPPGFDNGPPKSSLAHGIDTFWTVCTSCQVQYEYLRKYLNKRLSCKNCRGIFIAVETGTAPVNGSFPYCPSSWSYASDNGYGSRGHNGVAYTTSNSGYFAGNGVPGYQSGHGSDYNVSFQWNSFHGASSGVVEPNGLNGNSVDVIYQPNGSGRGRGRKPNMRNSTADVYTPVVTGYTEPPPPKRAYKKRKLDAASAYGNRTEVLAANTTSEVKMVNGYAQPNPEVTTPKDVPGRRCSSVPAFDARKMLIEKARTEIRKKLAEMEVGSVAKKKAEAYREVKVYKPGEMSSKVDSTSAAPQPELKRSESMSITVPDSDFHNFDKDRSEDCFKPKQIWALYDEEDGMPRLYCLIREIISVKPFKIHISYLSSKTDTEFGSVNWVDCGFTKSCGNFRAWSTDIVEQVNVFSHLLRKEKAGRGGCVRIYPKSGDIWAVYRNWSADWDRNTPAEVRHQYEMVEVLDDYSENLGVCVAPLIKLNQFKTVYQKNNEKEAVRWIPRREMVRFSHQVPSCLLKGVGIDLPEGCWDLDPAATPEELLGVSETANKVEDDDQQLQAKD